MNDPVRAATLKAVVARLRLVNRAVDHLPARDAQRLYGDARRRGLEWLRR